MKRWELFSFFYQELNEKKKNVMNLTQQKVWTKKDNLFPSQDGNFFLPYRS